MAQAKGARIAFIAEPDANISLMGSLIKRYSGNDRMFARKCNENGGSFDPMFKMMLYCNAVPPIEGVDDAVEDRLVIIPYLSKYCNDAPETVEEQFAQRRFPMDPHFDAKIEAFRKPMVWIMINTFEKYMKEGISKPKIVQEYTANYWKENNPYKLFVAENLLKTDNDGDKITATNVYKVFSIWFKTFLLTKRNSVPDAITLVKNLSSKNLLGEPKNRIWSGWRFNRFDGDESSAKPQKKHSID